MEALAGSKKLVTVKDIIMVLNIHLLLTRDTVLVCISMTAQISTTPGILS